MTVLTEIVVAAVAAFILPRWFRWRAAFRRRLVDEALGDSVSSAPEAGSGWFPGQRARNPPATSARPAGGQRRAA